MNINLPQIDWVTFTSWKVGDYIRWTDWMRKQPDEKIKSQIKMYSGYKTGSVFVGAGYQGDKEHFYSRISGEKSNELYREFYSPDVKTTRIDVQITKPLPIDYLARDFADDLRKGDWGSHKMGIQLIENSNGLDTVYIGSRESEKYARFYVKMAGEELFLRFEIEYKGNWANLISEQYYADENLLSSVLYDFINGIPKDNLGVIDGFLELLNGVKSGIICKRKVQNDDDTYDWIMTSCLPSIFRMLNDHDRGSDLAAVLVKMILKSTAGTHL